jgi:membrane-bound lytic murein transglycosylase A
MPTSTSIATSDSRYIQPITPFLRASALSTFLLLAACQVVPPAPPPTPPPVSAPPSQPTFAAVDYSALPGWDRDRVEDAWPAFLVGCKALSADPRTQATWQRICDAASGIDANQPGAVRAFLESNLIPYRVSAADGATSGTVSGYYEPLLEGSRTQSVRYSVPLYARPDDLLIVDLSDLYPELKNKRVRGRLVGNRVVPYFTRRDIDAADAAFHATPLVFVADPVEAFFFEIQGSGRIRLADGTVMRVGYADQNGHPFVSIARVLIDRGDLQPERASMQAIKAWGRAHSAELPALLAENPSYVFFREVPAPAPGTLEARIDGPIGTLGVPLLAERTIAVDARAIPLGAPVFLATTQPLSAEPLERLTLAQDTGGAIRGALRVDYFWGFGDEAGRRAGRMRQQGRMWVLWPRDAGAPSP